MKQRGKRALRELPQRFRGVGRNSPAKKQPVNLTVDGELLKEARQAGIKLSEVFEAHLGALLREKRRKQWLEQNREAIEAYNRRIARSGMFGDRFRRF